MLYPTIEALLGKGRGVGGEGGGVGKYVPSVNFKYRRFAFWGADHVPVGI